MPHDKDGAELHVDDIVFVPCCVKAIHLTADYCNVDLETKIGMPPLGTVQALTLNSRQTIKAARAGTPVPDWQPIETAPENEEVFFWVVPKTPEEAFVNTSGDPIFGTFAPHLHRGRLKSWSALSKATHWMRLPSPPRVTGET